jgi:hypothetical protein
MNAISSGLLFWALARLEEKSTWLGLAGLVASMAFLPHADADSAVLQQIGAIAGSVASIAAILHQERKAPK